jgi:hypothetical protein
MCGFACSLIFIEDTRTSQAYHKTYYVLLTGLHKLIAKKYDFSEFSKRTHQFIST